MCFFCCYGSGNADSDDYDYNSSYLYRRTQSSLLFQNLPCSFAAMKKLFHCSAYNLHSFGERDVTVSWMLTKQDLTAPNDKTLLSNIFGLYDCGNTTAGFYILRNLPMTHHCLICETEEDTTVLKKNFTVCTLLSAHTPRLAEHANDVLLHKQAVL